jgi:hypothetical protein
MNFSYAIQAIGWTIHTAKALGHEHDHGVAALDEHTHQAVTLFASLAADVLGLRFAQFADHGEFLGGQVGALQGQAGLGWSPTQAVTLQLSIGGRGNLAVGSMGAENNLALVHEMDLFGRIEALLGKGQIRWNVGLETGFHQLGVLEPGEAHDHATVTADHGAHGHAYVMISVGGSF